MVAVGVAAYASVGAIGGIVSGEGDPVLRFTQDVPADVLSASASVWTSFRERFHGRLACIDDVTVTLERSVEGGDARYVTAETRIEIEIPTTPSRFEESLAHELAHHLERNCSEIAPLRAQIAGLLDAADQPWSTGAAWAETPSERFAEAVVELVNGTRVRHVDTMPVEPEVVRLIARWGSGEALADPDG